MNMKIIVAATALLALPGSAFAQAIVVPAGASNSDSASSWVAGAQAGYNWQRGPWVYGLEADISAMRLKSEMNTLVPVVLVFPPLRMPTQKPRSTGMAPCGVDSGGPQVHCYFTAQAAWLRPYRVKQQYFFARGSEISEFADIGCENRMGSRRRHRIYVATERAPES